MLDMMAMAATHVPTQEQHWGMLIARIASGDQSALAELYDASSAQVFGLALRVLAERTAAEDVTLEVYTQVWRQAGSYDPARGTPGSWLMTVARTRAIDRFRAGYLERGAQAPLESAADLPGMGETPEQYAAGVERQRLVREALTALTSEQREAVSLAYYWGLSQSEIADRLQIPLGTVKTRVRLGMMKLREVLAPHEEGLRP
ncbi:MAG: sigma-70 family RNA polymerase sigma factor [Nitrospiraceae bacterium]|nr:sigma-70 family RNA polymerase sigma factor [Nitrospiraceae bacterium]